MWIGRDVILNYFQDFYGYGITVNGVKKSCSMLKVNLTPNMIQSWLKKRAELDGLDLNCEEEISKDKESLISQILKHNKKIESAKKYLLDRVDYSVYIESLDIYIEKCFKLCEMFEMLSNGSETREIVKHFDIKIDGEDILRDDVDRISKPLIKNYMLALETFIKANRYETYLNKIEKPIAFKYHDLLPRDYLLSPNGFEFDDCVDMSSRQMRVNPLSGKQLEKFSEDEDRLFIVYRAQHEDKLYDEWLGLK